MKRQKKYKKIDDWYYNSSKTNVRKRIKRHRNKSIRKIEKDKIKEYLDI